MILSALSLLAAQASAALSTAETGRLSQCLDQARSDPATAITTAGTWLAEATGPGKALPQQCLGQAYVSLLRWDAAEQAFLAGRDATVDDELRARLGAMAGNAALEAGDTQGALAALAAAEVDASAAGKSELAGTIASDRARALVALGQPQSASQALERARKDAPQVAYVWLLSATLDRRQDDLAGAAGFIATALALAPQDPQILLEAGVIAVLSGEEDTARGYWRNVMTFAPDNPEAATAAGYLDQLDGQGPVSGR
ncbi:hypothetical protein GRI89_09990 [Altererythrobacter salegens]|uniref:Uncharacterized protein n=1 Tax=Croceibacterium salegens TaxID=1737568 RepID=A0A6I4SWK6_9SPHN|nr:hypothetical protein [Croceibacterium salegens]MXO59868.1 hypothetical protein [Croceibacterium salegens]